MNISRVTNTEWGEMIRIEMPIREAQKLVSAIGALDKEQLETLHAVRSTAQAVFSEFAMGLHDELLGVIPK